MFSNLNVNWPQSIKVQKSRPVLTVEINCFRMKTAFKDTETS